MRTKMPPCGTSEPPRTSTRIAPQSALVKAGLMHVLSGDVERALALYERASRLHEQAGRYEDAIAARVMAAGALHDNGRVDDAIALLDEAKESLGPRADREVRDRLLVRLGFLYAFARRTDEAWAVAAAIRDETLAAVTPLAAEANFLRSALHAQRAEPSLWREHLDRGLDVFERIGALPDNVRAALGNGGVQALALGDLSLAHAYQMRALEKARELNSSIEYESYVLAEIELQQGNLDRRRARCCASTAIKPNSSRACSERSSRRRWRRSAATTQLPHSSTRRCSTKPSRADRPRRQSSFPSPTRRCSNSSGRKSEADRLFDSAVQTISTAYDMIAPIAGIALLRPKLAARLKSVVERSATRSQDRLNQALFALLEAAEAREAGNGDEALAASQIAAAASRSCNGRS